MLDYYTNKLPIIESHTDNSNEDSFIILYSIKEAQYHIIILSPLELANLEYSFETKPLISYSIIGTLKAKSEKDAINKCIILSSKDIDKVRYSFYLD
jgi:hypothetical protein